MRVRDVDRAILEAELGRATHAAWATPESQRSVRTKRERERIGDSAFHRKLLRVYDRRLAVLRAFRSRLVAEAARHGDSEKCW